MDKPTSQQAFSCARVDSNHHGENSPQGPQPCASTNSATSAEWASIASGYGCRTWVASARTCVRPRLPLDCEHMFVEMQQTIERGGIQAWI